jgi:hypothetical protein
MKYSNLKYESFIINHKSVTVLQGYMLSFKPMEKEFLERGWQES